MLPWLWLIALGIGVGVGACACSVYLGRRARAMPRRLDALLCAVGDDPLLPATRGSACRDLDEAPAACVNGAAALGRKRLIFMANPGHVFVIDAVDLRDVAIADSSPAMLVLTKADGTRIGLTVPDAQAWLVALRRLLAA